MKRPGCAALTAALYGTTIGCASGGGSDASIAQVTPTAAYSDAPFSITIVGAGFRPAYDVDTALGSAGLDTGGFTAFLAPHGSSGLPRVQATGLVWQSAIELWQKGIQLVAAFPAGIAAGSYDVGVHDPRGRDTIEADAFTSLGPDVTPPSVEIQQPGSGALVGADTDVDVVFYADDGFGTVASIGWRASDPTTGEMLSGSCPTTGTSGRQVCPFTLTVPTPASALDTLTLEAFAFDSVGLEGSNQVFLTLAPRPVVTSVAPRVASIYGGTEIDILGSNFVPPGIADMGTQILVDGQMISMLASTSTSLSGLLPAHDPGEVSLSVSSGKAETDAGSLTFVAPAVVRLVSPAVGPPAGGTPVAIVGDNFRAGGTTIWFGPSPLVCPRFVSPNRIEGWTPAGTGSVGVAAVDPVVNGNMLGDGFTYRDGADGGLASSGADGGGGLPPDGGCAGTGSEP
jgi:hypothetical protein